MRAIVVLGGVLCLTVQPATAAEEQYLCVAEKVSGFIFNKSSETWESTTFRTDRKYLIAPTKEHKVRGAFQITEVGQSVPSYFCKEPFNEGVILYCALTIGLGDLKLVDFRFNKENGRFLKAQLVGYFFNPSGEGGDTPFLEIGKCSPM